jgi:hypothetical protein
MVVSWPWTAHATDAPRRAARRFPGRPVVARSGEDLKLLLEEQEEGIAQTRRAV